jgi:hypothetical protein
MPRPDIDTPIEPIVNILRAAAPWCVTHKDALLEVAEPDQLDGLSAEGDALEAAANAFEREKRDAVDLTPRRDALLLSVRQLLMATIAAIRLQHHKSGQKTLRAISRRFVQSAHRLHHWLKSLYDYQSLHLCSVQLDLSSYPC